MSVSKPANDQGDSRELILDRFLPYRIVALGHAMGGQLRRAYADENLTIPEWRVLAVIAQSDRIAARDVVRLTPMDKMTVSRAIASLESKGFAQREVSETDRRVNMVSLTDGGRALFDRISRIALAYEDDLTSVLTNTEQNELDAALTKLIDKIVIGSTGVA